MKLIELQQFVENELEKITDSSKVECRLILKESLNIELIDLILNKSRDIDPILETEIRTIVERRLLGEPIQYILGNQNFMGHRIKVNSSVLIPRPETEIMTEYVISYLKENSLVKNVMDLGAGSGAIGISICKANPNVKVLSVDISNEALIVARENAILNGVEFQMTFVQSDLFMAFENLIVPQMDVIVSNPPYIPMADKCSLAKEVESYEPEIALFGGEDGLDFYRKIVPNAKAYLSHGGLLIFEAGHDHSKAILDLFKNNGYVSCGIFCDLNNIPRFIYGSKP